MDRTDKAIVNLWAGIGSEDYWRDLVRRHSNIFVPFTDRWPQPGYIGRHYFKQTKRILVMGQNPRAEKSGRPIVAAKDEGLFNLIRRHARLRSESSLDDIFEFMLGFFSLPETNIWPPLAFARNNLDLAWDNIAYLNLIPLATRTNKLSPVRMVQQAYEISTQRQLDILKPLKIVVYGKDAFDKLVRFRRGDSDIRYVENGWMWKKQREEKAQKIKKWLQENSG